MVTVCRERVFFDDAALLALKLAAFAFMVADHVDWLLFDAAYGIHDTIGRAVFPTFALVLAMNLCRARDLYRLALRMAIVGLVASLPYIALQGHWWPLNIMFTLALAVVVVGLWRDDMKHLAVWSAVLGGFVVDYQWFGLLAILGPYWLMRRGESVLWGLLLAILCMVPINGNAWALLALPLFLGVSLLEGSASRLKWLFYVGYPAHLVLLWLVSRI